MDSICLGAVENRDPTCVGEEVIAILLEFSPKVPIQILLCGSLAELAIERKGCSGEVISATKIGVVEGVEIEIVKI